MTTAADFIIGSLCAWRKARASAINHTGTWGDIEDGMRKTIAALVAISVKTCIYTEATRPGAFPEMTAKGNAELVSWPAEDDGLFDAAIGFMEEATLYGYGEGGISVVIGGLCAWREDRGGGCNGMQAVINVLANRAAAHRSTIYREATRPLQFSAMSAPGDPELNLWPASNDENFLDAQALTAKAVAGTLEDLTRGAVSYYAKSMMHPPYWAATMIPTVEIGGQLYFKLSKKEA